MQKTLDRRLVDHYARKHPHAENGLKSWLAMISICWRSANSLGAGILWFLYGE
jgi:hypothetical protein